MRILPFLLLAVVSSSVALTARPWLVSERRRLEAHPGERTPLYLPEARYVRLVTLGFDELAADIVWFYTHNYFGRQFQNKGTVKWLGHMCDLVTTLSPRAAYVYDFCSTTLSWVAHEPEESNRMLTKGMGALPKYWRLPYLRAFNFWYFLEDRQSALRDLKQAASFPDAPPFLASLTSRLMSEEGDAATAVGFLTEFYKREKNPSAKLLIEEKLKLAVLTRDLQELRRAVAFYKERQHVAPRSIEDLVSSGIVTNLPPDPFGGSYTYNPDSDSVGSSSGKEELKFHGKTARMGMNQSQDSADILHE